MPVNSHEVGYSLDGIAVWDRAVRRMLSFGVGMSKVSKNERLIRDTVARGVEVHVVMVDPGWVLGSREISAAFDSFYREHRFGEKFREAHARLTAIALDVNNTVGQDRMQIHTYQSMVPQSATIADPGSREAFGHMELHAYGRFADRIRTPLPGSDRSGRLLAHTLRSISNLADHDFTRESPSDVGTGLSPLLTLA